MAKSIAAQKKLLQKQLDNLIKVEDKAYQDKWMPIMKKKYEGKYFSFENGYNSEQRWTGFLFVKKVIAIHSYQNGEPKVNFSGVVIERDCNGSIRIETINGYSTTQYSEIHQRVFKRKLGVILEHVAAELKDALCITFELHDNKNTN